jgi:phosphoribosyl 1,2-cyclic phosphodiesterase
VIVTVLGSGSSGNSILVETDGTRVLIDAGFSGRDLERRLASVDRDPASIDAIFITHEHGDHTKGMGIFARRWGTPIYLSEQTRRACSSLLSGEEAIHDYSCVNPVAIGTLRIEPFLTVHDAVDPFAVTVTESRTGEKLGIATDLGRPTAAVRHALSGCDILVLEANHDEILLRESSYPWSVKQRIASSHGHLSNRASADLAAEIHHHNLTAVVLAHLSERANAPGLAHEIVGERLATLGYRGALEIGKQDVALEPLDVTALRRRLTPEQLTLL